MAVTKKSIAQPEARADTSVPDVRDLQAEAQAGLEAVGAWPAGLEAVGAWPAGRETVGYRYVGGLDGVLVVVEGTAYEARRGGLVTMPEHEAMDRHPDFQRVALPEGAAAAEESEV